VSANERFPVYNHYYTRGYLFNRAADGNHTVPSEGTNDGFGSVGCSRTLALPVLDKIELGKIFNCDTTSAAPVTSLFFYPHFSSERGKRFGIVGQTVTCPNGNFVNPRPNFFTHNYVFTPAGLKYYAENRGLESIVSMSFREKYVHESEATGSDKELVYQQCIDEPLGSMLEIPHNGQVGDDTGLTMAQAKALILALTKPKARVVVRVADDNEGIDARVRPIIKILYRCLPVKIADNLGFITCLNGSNAHESCNLLFCSTEDYRRIKKDGLPGKNNEILVYVDLVDSSSNLLPENANLNDDECAYIEWMAAILSGSARTIDIAIQNEICKQEYALLRNRIEYSYLLLARIYQCISKLAMDKMATTEDRSMLLIHCFSMIYSASTISNECVAELMPLMEKSISFVKNDPDAYRSTRCDRIIIAIEERKPETLNSVVRELLNNQQQDVVGWISKVRAINKPIKEIYDMFKKNLLLGLNPSTLAGLVADKYEKGDFSPEEAPLGHEMAAGLVNGHDNDGELLAGCHRLWNYSVSACTKLGIPVFGNVKTMAALLEELEFIASISKNSKKSINDNCCRIFREISRTESKPELEVVSHLVANAGELAKNLYSSEVIPEVLSCILNICQKSGTYQYGAVANFCSYAKNHTAASGMNKQALATIAAEFTKAIALHGNDRNLLEYAALIIENEQNALPGFVESIAPALTVQMVAVPESLPTESQNRSDIRVLNSHKRRVVCYSIYNQFFEGITLPDSGYGKMVADTLMAVPLEQIGCVQISGAVAAAYNLNADDGARSIRRQRRGSLEAAEQKLCQTKEHSAGFQRFLAALPIDPPPRYTNKDILDNMCIALEGGEDVKKKIQGLISTFEKLDVANFMCFTNSALARGSALFRNYLNNAKIAGSNKSESERRMLTATLSAVKRMFDRKAEQITDASVSAASRFRSYYSSVANCVVYEVENYVSTKLLELKAIPVPVFSGEDLFRLAISALSEIEAVRGKLYNHFAAGGGYSTVEQNFFGKIKAVNDSLDSRLVSSLDASSCSMLAELLSKKMLDGFARYFPQSCDRLICNAMELCQSEPTSKQLAPIAKGTENSIRRLQNENIKGALGQIYSMYSKANRKSSATKGWVVSLTLAACAAIVVLILNHFNLLRPGNVEPEYTCRVSNEIMLVDEDWIVCADRENIVTMRLELTDGQSIPDEKANKEQAANPAASDEVAEQTEEMPALTYVYTKPQANGEETEPVNTHFAFLGQPPCNNYTYSYKLRVTYELSGHYTEGEDNLIMFENDRAVLRLERIKSLDMKYIENVSRVEVTINDIKRNEPAEAPIDEEELPVEYEKDLSGITIYYELDDNAECNSYSRNNALSLKQLDSSGEKIFLDRDYSYSYTIQLVFDARIPKADKDDRLTIIYKDESEITTGSASEVAPADTSETVAPTDASETEAPTDASETEAPTDASETEAPADTSETAAPADTSETATPFWFLNPLRNKH